MNILSKNYFWIYIVISIFIFAAAVFVLPKILRLLGKISEKKDTPDKQSAGKKKQGYKTF